MSYIVAKKFGSVGSIAYEMERGSQMAQLIHELNIQTEGTDIQILSVSSMEAFPEYRPYSIVESENEFRSKVLEMKK